MAAPKGTMPPNAGKGRPKGVPNKVTQNAREAFEMAFQGLGGYGALLAWAYNNQTEFFKLYARLIPVAMAGPEGVGPMQTVVQHVYETLTANKA